MGQQVRDAASAAEDDGTEETAPEEMATPLVASLVERLFELAEERLVFRPRLLRIMRPRLSPRGYGVVKAIVQDKVPDGFVVEPDLKREVRLAFLPEHVAKMEAAAAEAAA